MWRLWSMMNSLQIITQLDLYSVQSPGNVDDLTSQLSDAATFDWVEVDYTNSLYFPEVELLPKFITADFNKPYVLVNLDFLLIVILCIICLHIL